MTRDIKIFAGSSSTGKVSINECSLFALEIVLKSHTSSMTYFDLSVFKNHLNLKKELTEKICKKLSIRPGKLETSKFANGETKVVIEVRNILESILTSDIIHVLYLVFFQVQS